MKIILAIILLSNLGLSSLAVLAQTTTEPIPVSEVEALTPVEGTAADLADVDNRDNVVDNWGVGGENSQGEQPPIYQMRRESKRGLLNFEPSQPNTNEWEKQNHGDVPSQGGVVPLSRFR